MDNISTFLETYYPNYSSSDDVARWNDLGVLLETKNAKDLDLGSCASRVLEQDYGDDLDNPHIKEDHDLLEAQLTKVAMKEFLKTMKVLKLMRNFRAATGALANYFVEDANDIVLQGINTDYPFKVSFDDLTYEIDKWISSTQINLFNHEA